MTRGSTLQQPADQAVRDRVATDFETTLLLEAGAGTGKTTVLVARILALVRSGRAPLDRIVAITFTEKAAGELKLRLRDEFEKRVADLGDASLIPLIALTRNGRPLASADAGATEPIGRRPTVSEQQRCGFQLEHPESDMEYSITIGDLSTSEAAGVEATGVRLGVVIVWPDALYFESARGQVQCRLRSRPALSAEPWSVRVVLPVDVLPTKLGDHRYLAMFEELRGLAGALVFELASKALRGTGFEIKSASVGFRGSHVELRLIEQAWSRIAPALEEIERAPATRLQRTRVTRTLPKANRIGSRAIRDLVGQGIDPRSRASASTVRVPVEDLAITTDTRENRIVRSMVGSLLSRCRDSVNSVNEHIESIEADRVWRDRAMGDGPTLYDAVDRPRLDRLRAAVRQGRRLHRAVGAGLRTPFLADLKPLDAAPAGPTFEHVRPYRRIRGEMARYLRSSLILMADGGGSGSRARVECTSSGYSCSSRLHSGARGFHVTTFADWSGRSGGSAFFWTSIGGLS